MVFSPVVLWCVEVYGVLWCVMWCSFLPSFLFLRAGGVLFKTRTGVASQNSFKWCYTHASRRARANRTPDGLNFHRRYAVSACLLATRRRLHALGTRNSCCRGRALIDRGDQVRHSRTESGVSVRGSIVVIIVAFAKEVSVCALAVAREA